MSASKIEDLRGQLIEAARDFSGSERKLDEILLGMADDIERSVAERLEIFPVCHHSPASALFMVRRLLEKRPKVIFLELCEDLLPLLPNLRQCKLPVSLQAFAPEPEGFPKSWAPLSVVAPITEFSAEYQALCYALEQPDCEVVFVDRSVDHVFQWMPQEEDTLEKEQQTHETPPEEEAGMHGSAIGLQLGELRPDFAEFEQALLHNANVRHYSEWWELYVEDALVGRSYDTYRRLMSLIGSLYRRLRPDAQSLKIDEERERYMWQRMKEYLATHQIPVEDCLYICGAFHAVSHVDAFGIDTPVNYEISPRTATKWLYGVIPSSYSAIEWQFGLNSGAIAIASANWKKSAKKLKISPFRLAKNAEKAKALPKRTPAAPAEIPFTEFLALKPQMKVVDTTELVNWSAEIVRMARKNGYLASTADSIAIYQHSVMLAQLRNREHPTPYDFQDAAITCLEKEMTPRKRDIRRLCEILLGGDRIGQVGYDSLPPLAQDVYQRLKPLDINLEARTIQRALLDFTQHEELRACSDLLWKLRYLLDDYAVRPIMGERRLGVTSKQESWDVAIGKYQRAIIELGYEGVTVEQVLEQRLKRSVFGGQANAAIALEAVEDSILFLKSRRLTEELGERAVELLLKEESARNAPEIFHRIRTLLHYYRSSEPEIPHWLNDFVVKGYSHYCTMLPQAFEEDEASALEISAMLGFIMTLESLALSLGCNREQLTIALQQSVPGAPAKKSLLWSAECLLDLKSLSELRRYFDHVLSNPLLIGSLPDYLSGFVLALEFNPLIARFVAELMSKAFEGLPDSVLFPWLPKLIMTLRRHAAHLLPKVLKEVETIVPLDLSALDDWIPEWEKAPQPVAKSVATAPLDAREQACRHLLYEQRESCDAMAALLGIEGQWQEIEEAGDALTPEQLDPRISACRALLEQHPESCQAMEPLVT